MYLIRAPLLVYLGKQASNLLILERSYGVCLHLHNFSIQERQESWQVCRRRSWGMLAQSKPVENCTFLFRLLVCLYTRGVWSAFLTPSHGSFYLPKVESGWVIWWSLSFKCMNIVHCKDKCEENSFIMRNAQMVSQKCALPAPVPWISPASVEQLTGKKNKIKTHNLLPFLYFCTITTCFTNTVWYLLGETKNFIWKKNNACCCNISSENLRFGDVLLVFINFVCRYDMCLDKNSVPLWSVWSSSLHHKCLVLKRLKEKLKLSCHFRHLTGGF